MSSRSDLHVTVAKLGTPADEDQLATARGYSNHSMPPALEALCKQMNGFQLEWESDSGDAGAIQLLPVERIFGSWKDVIWFPGEDERFADLYPFDFFQPETCIAFRMPKDQKPERDVQLHALGEAATALGRDFNDYIELVLESRGYLHWQQTLSTETQNNPDAVRFRERAPALFPGLKLERFKP